MAFLSCVNSLKLTHTYQPVLLNDKKQNWLNWVLLISTTPSLQRERIMTYINAVHDKEFYFIMEQRCVVSAPLWCQQDGIKSFALFHTNSTISPPNSFTRKWTIQIFSLSPQQYHHLLISSHDSHEPHITPPKLTPQPSQVCFVKRLEFVNLLWIWAWLSLPLALFAWAACAPVIPSKADFFVEERWTEAAFTASGYRVHSRGRSETLETFSASILHFSRLYSIWFEMSKKWGKGM